MGKLNATGHVQIFEKRYALHKIYTWPLAVYFTKKTKKKILQSLIEISFE